MGQTSHKRTLSEPRKKIAEIIAVFFQTLQFSQLSLGCCNDNSLHLCFIYLVPLLQLCLSAYVRSIPDAKMSVNMP